MKRREFITLLGGAAAWPLAAHAQHKLPVIGYLGASTSSAGRERVSAFVQRLRELGWIEGRTEAIEYRWADGRSERYGEIASEFVRLKIDVLVTAATAPTLAAKRATSIIPIVFALAADPVGNGLVESLAQPGGNITGLSNQSADLVGKRLELLREVVPRLAQLAILANVRSPAASHEMKVAETSARTLGFTPHPLEVRRPEDISLALGSLGREGYALYVCSDPLVNAEMVRINTLALGARLPTMYLGREYVASGGFMSYGPDLPDLYRRAAEYVDRILHGANPADIPVEQPTKFELIVNLTTAKALGLKVPEAFLLRADEVIE
jgi:putative ABC transport system substrate-binding protein